MEPHGVAVMSQSNFKKSNVCLHPRPAACLSDERTLDEKTTVIKKTHHANLSHSTLRTSNTHAQLRCTSLRRLAILSSAKKHSRHTCSEPTE